MTIIRTPSKTVEAPILVEVVRGQMVESRHHAIVAVVDSAGKVAESWGNIERPIYGRSSIKPLLAIPLVETGAADHFGLSDAEIAVATASHNAEPRHVETVLAWLNRVGLSGEDLECGPQNPARESDYEAMIRSGQKGTPAHNNCSGKHAGFLTTAVHLGEPTKGYIQYEHPVQQRLLRVLEEMCDLKLGNVPRGIDGCGIPVIATEIGNLAYAMARMADPGKLSPERAKACSRILAAMMKEPFMVAGTGRFCTKVMEAAHGKVAIKVGAEGVYAGALPGLGLGVCIKAEDGNARAAEVAMGQVLRRLKVLNEDELARLHDTLTPPIHNRAGTLTGVIRPINDGSF